MIDWINNDKNSAVTIYNNNITLSKQASRFFEDAYRCNVGVDTDTNELIIMKISKEEYEKNYSDKTICHKIDIKSSYGRINSKSLVDKICEKLELEFTDNVSFKFDAKWNNGKKMLVVATDRKRGTK